MALRDRIEQLTKLTLACSHHILSTDCDVDEDTKYRGNSR